MGWVALIVGMIVLGIIAFLVAGANVPSRPVMATFLKKELEKCEISGAAFPEACIAELADSAVKHIEFEIKLGTMKGAVNTLLEGEAAGVASIVRNIVVGEGLCTAEEIKAGVANETPNWVWEILVKHDPGRFSLDHLANTQATNALLRPNALR
jgi:hypothetical protein